MKILINCSCLHNGGGLQVAESIISFLGDYSQHSSILILSDELKPKISMDSLPDNCKVYFGNTPGIKTMITGRYKPYDNIIINENVDCVLTVFGPSRWKPRVPHLCGFARPHMVMTDSVFFKRMPYVKRLKERTFYCFVRWSLDRSSGDLYTENELISERLSRLLPKHRVWTVTNNYNQVFDKPEVWKDHMLPDFDGVTLLCVTAAYPHKNLQISIDVARILREQRPDLRFRFIFTVTPNEFPIPDGLKNCFELIGRVEINECPSLYRQADIMFQPSLLECFFATYAEAMKMEVPIVTTDLDFAKGLCKDAAVYYSPLDASEATTALLKVIDSDNLKAELIDNGKKVLKSFDTAKQRADKLIKICENLTIKNQ